MASSIQKLHDHYLSCIICTELYRDPCTLVCGHTFCRECLAKFAKTQEHAIKAKSLLCPNCRQMTRVPYPDKPMESWVNQIKPSILVQGLLDDFVAEKSLHKDKERAEDLKKNRKHICKDHNIDVEYLCKDCCKTICQKCRSLIHRKCDNIVTIESILPEMKDVLLKNKDLMVQEAKTAKFILMQSKKKVKDIETCKKRVQADITDVIQKAIKQIKLKERHLMNELEYIADREIKEVIGQTKSEEINIQTYQQCCEYIDQIVTSQSAMDMFDIYQLCQSGSLKVRHETTSQCTDTSAVDEIISVEEYDRRIIENLQIGSIRILKEEFDPQCTPTIVDTIDISTESDKETPDPMDVTVLDVDGTETLVVTDFGNASLKCFYTRGKQSHRRTLIMKRKPWSVIKLHHNYVAVTFESHNEILVLRVTPELVLHSNLKTQKRYRCLARLNDTQIVAGCAGPPSLDILDITGHVQRCIIPADNLIKAPYFLCATNTGNILISDCVSDSVYCLTQEGEIVFSYAPKSGARGGPRGITTSPKGDILVADGFNDKVIQLTETGDFVRDLVVAQDGNDRPCGICLHKHKLYVTGASKPLKVFRVNRKK